MLISRLAWTVVYAELKTDLLNSMEDPGARLNIKNQVRSKLSKGLGVLFQGPTVDKTVAGHEPSTF